MTKKKYISPLPVVFYKNNRKKVEICRFAFQFRILFAVNVGWMELIPRIDFLLLFSVKAKVD